MPKKLNPVFFIEEHSKRLFDLALEAETAAGTLVELRKNAGAKSKWSAHVKMEEAVQYRKVSKPIEAIQETIVANLPEEWGMSHWGFRPARMGGDVRWAGKGGKSQNGTNANLYGGDFCRSVGTLLGLIAFHDFPHSEDLARMKRLDVSEDETHRFFFSETLQFEEATAHHPTSAYAAYQATKLTSLQSSFEARDPWLRFKDGITNAESFLDRPRTWSLAAELWDKIRKHKTTKRLAQKAAPNVYLDRPFWKDYDLPLHDDALAATLRLLEQIPAAPPRTPLSPYLLQTSKHSYAEAMGWCGDSAILRSMINTLYDQKPLEGFENWKVFAIADECGANARQITHSLGKPEGWVCQKKDPDPRRRGRIISYA